MITFEEFNKFPIETKNKIIDCIFASNVESELIRIKNDINSKGDKSEFTNTLLENINLKYDNIFGRFYEVTGLFNVSLKSFGIDLEEDNDFIKNQKRMPEEFSKLVDENFNDLI